MRDFTKLASCLCAVDFDWSPLNLNQWGAHVNRPFTSVKPGIGPDEIVPISYLAYLFDSQFCRT